MVISSRSTMAALLGVLTIIMVGWVLHAGASILQPLVIALLLTSMLQPIVRLFARWHIPPVLTVILLVTLLFFGLARLGLLLQANVLDLIGVERVAAVEGGVRAAPRLGGWTEIVDNIAVKMQTAELPEPLIDFVHDSLRNVNLRQTATELLGGGLTFVRGLVLVVIYMLFLFAEQAVFRRKILAVSGENREEAADILDTIGRGIQRYLGVKTVVSFATGLLCYSVLVALEIPYALLFGFLTFLLNYIPTFGSIIACIFPAATALAFDPSWEKAVIVVFTYLLVNMVLGSFIEPRILGRELNLSPLVIIISVVVWAGLWGVTGTFLAVPLTSAIQIILASFDSTRPIAVLLSSGPPRDDDLRSRITRRLRRGRPGDAAVEGP